MNYRSTIILLIAVTAAVGIPASHAQETDLRIGKPLKDAPLDTRLKAVRLAAFAEKDEQIDDVGGRRAKRAAGSASPSETRRQGLAGERQQKTKKVVAAQQ